tara:strand:+ start:366 stop:467 length:102 start_codon:yes stop_codon:yes gene_type:complete
MQKIGPEYVRGARNSGPFKMPGEEGTSFSGKSL